MRARLFELNSSPQSRQTKYEDFIETFPHLNSLTSKDFNTYSKRYFEHFRKKKHVYTSEYKQSYIKTFSNEIWEKLDEDCKCLHSLDVCQPCKFIVFNHVPSTLPLPALPPSTSEPVLAQLCLKSFLLFT